MMWGVRPMDVVVQCRGDTKPQATWMREPAPMFRWALLP
jgi:hypothetical protein